MSDSLPETPKLRMLRSAYDAWGGQLEARVEAFRKALDDHQFTVDVPAPTEIEDDPAPPARRIRMEELFLQRLTRKERQAMIETAAVQLADGNGELHTILADLRMSEWAYLDDPQLTKDLAAFADAGALEPERVAQVLV
jgi:hypothetical protein